MHIYTLYNDLSSPSRLTQTRYVSNVTSKSAVSICMCNVPLQRTWLCPGKLFLRQAHPTVIAVPLVSNFTVTVVQGYTSLGFDNKLNRK